FVLKKDRPYVIAHSADLITKTQLTKFQVLVKKRAARMPLAYIVGTKEFYGLPFFVSKNTLIPRPDTETLITAILNHLKQHPHAKHLVDVGTGSGCIPLAIAANTGTAIKIDAFDVSAPALTSAKKNAKVLSLDKRVKFAKHNLLKGVSKKYDVIIANLPYLSKKEYAFAIKHFPEIQYEPKSALLSGKDGLDLIRVLMTQVPKRLRKKGAVFLEIGYEQGIAVTDIAMQHFPKASVSIIKDDCGRDRIAHIQTHA
ncbi:MAG: peptide chain release factor N(5)-glutamine methyltransferase, partial [Patescibacteria group bacterium]